MVCFLLLAQISSCSANVYQTLLFKIDNDQIPREYGGASVHGLGEHPYEVRKRGRAKFQRHGCSLLVYSRYGVTCFVFALRTDMSLNSSILCRRQ